jgi:uncharacterized protein (TIGR03118 family)
MIRKNTFLSCTTAFLTLVLLPLTALAQHYQQTNLVSDVSGLAAVTDSDLQNAWGLARSPTSPWWVADNGTGKSTIYHADGAKQALIVTVPPATGSAPTGVVFHSGAGFNVPGTNPAAPAVFIFATEDGTVAAWNSGSTAVLTPINNPGSAIYKGLALATFNGHQLLYLANFKTGTVDVFDDTWASTSVPGVFVDTELPAGYVPFNVQNIGGNLFVTYALKADPSDEDEQHGRGLGYVDEFDSGGHLLMRLQHGPWLDAPWGVAQSPANFGEFSDNILVGNFGSGEIDAFDPASGEFLGRLHGPRGRLMIDGLWAIAFGGGVNTVNNGSTNELFFTAGIDDEAHGLFGKLTTLKNKDDDQEEDHENGQAQNHEHENDENGED